MKSFYERQQPLVAMLRLSPTTIADGGFSLKLPRGAWVTNIVALKNTAFNTAGTTPTVTLTVTDGTTAFINAQALTGTGAITVATTTKYLPNGATITGVITEGVASGAVTSATAGDAVLRVEYVQLDKGGDIQG